MIREVGAPICLPARDCKQTTRWSNDNDDHDNDDVVIMKLLLLLLAVIY